MIDGLTSRAEIKLKIGRKQIALLQAAKNQLGLTRDEYQHILGSVGAKSSKDLYPSQFYRLLDYLKNLGFVPVSHQKSLKKVRDAFRERIEKRMADTGITDGYVDTIIKRMGFNIEHWKWCDADQMEQILIFLCHQQKYQKTGYAEEP